jgi:glycosyltransferase involved in cell wall biosynthesis
MTFTIVMPSYLGHYPGAAKDRDKKIHRAVDSVTSQSYQDYQLLIVCDGCQTSFNRIKQSYIENEKIDCVLIPKQPIWSGAVRNAGIHHGKGEYIAYLDIDDTFGQDHLKVIADGIKACNYPDWVWYNDMLPVKKEGKYIYEFKERQCDINKRFQHGTSNIVHKRIIRPDLPPEQRPEYWKVGGYLHDYWFIQGLKKYTHYKIPTPDYRVHHVPKEFDL